MESQGQVNHMQEYIPTLIEPCALDANNRSQPFHLLKCGHMVAVDCVDLRCGINCLHVATWMIHKQSSQQEEEVDIAPGLTLLQALTSSRPRNPVKPPESHTQALDELFCEMCQGLPVASIKRLKPEWNYRRALSLTRPVIEHYTSYAMSDFDTVLAPLFYNPNGVTFNLKKTHRLRCGHEVWVNMVRPCASNCYDTPQCRGREYPQNIKQGDAILCKECTYRAELVYARYAWVEQGGGKGDAARQTLQSGGDEDARSNIYPYGIISHYENAQIRGSQGTLLGGDITRGGNVCAERAEKDSPNGTIQEDASHGDA